MSNLSSKCLSVFLRSFAIVLTQHIDAVFLTNCLWHIKSIIKISCEPHLINTLIKESQAGIFIAHERALFYEAAEHLSFGHEGVKPLMGAVSALQEACGTKHVTKWHVNGSVMIMNLTCTSQTVAEHLSWQDAAFSGNGYHAMKHVVLREHRCSRTLSY